MLAMLAMLAALAIVVPGAGAASGETQALTPAARKQKLAELRDALQCMTFHYNRLERFQRAGNGAAAEQAEELWLDWDDLAMDIEETLHLPLHEEAAETRAVETAHAAQIARIGWPAYEKAWMGKCGKSPF